MHDELAKQPEVVLTDSHSELGLPVRGYVLPS